MGSTSRVWSAAFALFLGFAFAHDVSAQVLQIVSGDGQTGAPGSAAAAKLVVRLVNPASQQGVPGQKTNWSVISGHATLSTSSTTTDNFGQTSIRFIYGPNAGDIFIRASSAGSFVDFHETAVTPPSAVLAPVSGDAQNGGAYLPAAAPLVVQLTLSGAPVANQTVNWSVVTGQATLTSGSTRTDGNGQSSNTFTYGAAGDVLIQASAGTQIVRFHATAQAPVISVVSGDHQSGASGTPADAPLLVKLTANGQPVANQNVVWSVSGNSVALGSPPAATQTTTTDANGVTTMTFSYIGAGTSSISADPGTGGNVVIFTVTSFAPAAGATSGNNQTGPVGSTLQPFVIQVGQPAASASIQSAHTKGLGGLAVSWSVVQGGGTLASAQTLTDASGRTSNTLKLGSNPGVNLVQANIGCSGCASIQFTATATAGAPAGSQLSIAGGGSQQLTPLTPSAPLIVKLVDAQGQPVPGIDVLWTETGASGTLQHPDATTTDANGQTQNVLTVILPGVYSVTAKVADTPGIAPVTFNFNNGVVNLTGLTPAQIAVAHAIDMACPALFVMNAASPGSLDNRQQDFLGRCSEVVVRSGTNPAQVPAALDAMLNNKSLPQRNLAQGVQLGQYGNLNTRLAELRQGASGISFGGLGMIQDGRSLPLATFGDLLRKDPGAGSEVGQDLARWGFFATGMIQRGGFSAMNEQPGFDYHNASLTAGVDYRFNADFVAGVALGYNNNRSSLDADAGKIDIDGYSLDGYFTWYHNDFYVEGSATLGWLSYDLRRHINYEIDSLAASGGVTVVNQIAAASPDGRQDSLSLSVGKDFNRQAWTFGPYLRGVYTHLSLDGFSETLSDPGAPGGGLGTSVDARSPSSLLGVIGARASVAHSFDWGVLVPNAMVEWNHEFRNDAQTVVARFLADPTQTPVVLSDVPPDSNYFNIGIGLNAVLPQGRSGYVYFEHMAGYAGAHENRLSLGIRVEF